MKLRVVELLLVTTLPALFLAAKGVPPLGLTIATLVGGTIVIPHLRRAYEFWEALEEETK